VPQYPPDDLQLDAVLHLPPVIIDA
jgi:hypothetical protein